MRKILDSSIYKSSASHKRFFYGLFCLYLSFFVCNFFCVGAHASDYSLTIDIAGNIGMKIIPNSESGTFASSDIATPNISVKTDNYSGYTLGISASANNDNALKNASDNTITIPSITSSVSAENYANDSYAMLNNLNNTWGYRPSKINSEINTDFLQAPTSTSAVILDQTTVANSDNNMYNIAIGSRIDITQASGIYSNAFIITAVANPVSYDIAYDANGGTNAPTATRGNTLADTISLSPNAPTRTGYSFSGWCASGDSETSCSDTIYQVGASYPISQIGDNNITLYAVWRPNIYTVNLDNQSATTAGATTIYETYGSKYSLTSDGDAMTTSVNPITKPARSYTYSITYHANSQGAAYTASPTSTTRTDAFKGYYTAASGGAQYIDANGYLTNDASTTNFSAAGTLYAQWTDGSASLTLPAISKTDHTCKWAEGSTSGDQYAGGAQRAIVADTHYYAICTANAYTVSFSGGNLVYNLFDVGATMAERMVYSVSNGVVAVTASQDDGYGFINARVNLEAGKTYTVSAQTSGTWGTQAEMFLILNGEYNEYYYVNTTSTTITPTTGGTYWFRLDSNINGQTIYFSNISVKEVISPKPITYGATYGTLPTPSNRGGHTFSGWYTADNCGGSLVSSSTTFAIATDQTVYACWVKNQYTLDLNGFLDGAISGGIANFGTVDVYINGVLVANDVSDYYAAWAYGTTYQITDIKTVNGAIYNGIYSGSLSGIIANDTVLILNFISGGICGPFQKMQDIGSIKNNLQQDGTQMQLCDNRDGRLYWVGKLADGNVWMTQNLDYNILAGDNEVAVVGGGTTTWSASYATFSAPFNSTDNTGTFSYDPGDQYVQNGNSTTPTANIACTATNNSGEICHYHLGNYYQWRAAIANSAIYKNDNNYDAPNSICPRGWRLPIANQELSSSNKNYSFRRLLNEYGYQGSTADSALTSNPLWFAVTSGISVYGELRTNSTSFWTSTYDGPKVQDGYALFFNRSSYNATSTLREQKIQAFGGYGVRCVAE